jgi:hypothetical protein
MAYKLHRFDEHNYVLTYQERRQKAASRLGYISTSGDAPMKTVYNLIYEHMLFQELPLLRDRCRQRAAEIVETMDRPAGGAS